MNIDKQKQVMDIVWPWKKSVEITKVEPSRPALKKLLLELLITVSVGTLFWFAFKEKQVVAVVIFTIASYTFLTGIFVPPFHYAFKRLFQKFAVGVGAAMTWILLLPFFYIFFTIGRISQLIFRKDSMNRACPTEADTYWIKHPATDVASYSRQY